MMTAKKNRYVRFEKGEKYCKYRDEDREICDTPADFDDAGYILKSDEVVVDIDCLDRHQIEALIETFEIKTQIVWTDRGAHFYFKRPRGFKRSNGICGLGFKVEYKHYDNNFGITIKRNGQMREIVNEDMRETFPKYFDAVSTNRSLLGMTEGDGRNEALFNFKRKILRNGNVPKILNFINNYIFDEPLEQREFEVVAREEVVGAEKDGENLIADTIMKERKVIYYNNTLFYYNDLYYTCDENEFNRMVYEYCSDQKTRYIDEVIKQMKYRANMVPKDTIFKIKLHNGYLHNGEFYPISYHEFTPYYIDLDFNEDVEPVEIVDSYLNNLTDNNPEYKDFILEVIASCFIVDPEIKRLLSKFFVFVGGGGNGKGTLLQIITKILGRQNISACSISELVDEKYFNNLIGKLANLGDDIQNEPINRNQMKRLKNLSSGDEIQVRRLYENATTVQLSPTLIFTSNNKVKTFDKDYSYKRRVVWCPMYTKPNSIDPKFISKLTTDEALEYWIRLLIEAYKRLYKNGQFTESEKVQNFTEEYHRENDSTIEYVEELEDSEIIMKRPPEVFNKYEEWCENNGETCQSKSRLREQILAKGFEVRSVCRKEFNGGKTAKVYVKKGKDEEL